MREVLLNQCIENEKERLVEGFDFCTAGINYVDPSKPYSVLTDEEKKKEGVERYYWRSFTKKTSIDEANKFNLVLIIECDEKGQIRNRKVQVINTMHGIALSKYVSSKEDITFIINFFSGNWKQQNI